MTASFLSVTPALQPSDCESRRSAASGLIDRCRSDVKHLTLFAVISASVWTDRRHA